MNYNKILDMLNKIKLSEINDDDECMICQLPILSTDRIIKLKCNHNYHKECIKDNIYSKKYNKITCPYCTQVSHKKKCGKCNLKFFTSKCECLDKHKCQAYFKSGKNKGKQCNKINCKRHKNNKIQEINKCKIILKSGKNKGQICSRINCGYHKKTINIII